MGEYATRKSDGENVKIGTCENMYYLRADQAEMVAPESGNVDPIRNADGIRFRFPFPNEDHIAPGGFDDYNKSVGVYVDAASIPTFDHYSVQFSARVGYLMSVPCPEASELPYTVHKNGWVGGTARIVQQRVWDGRLVTVAACPGCDGRYRLETLEMAEPYIVACRAEADRAQQRANVSPHGKDSEASTVAYWHTIADRIEQGYTNPPAWVQRVMVPA